MLHMLIVKDEKMIRKGLVHTTGRLSMDCVVVAEAADDQDGYEKILECRSGVVIMDICMPLIDDIEVIKKTSEQVRFKSILLISYTDFEYTGYATEARVCEYLLKPVDGEALADIMERLGEEIVSSRQVECVMEQVEIEKGNLNLEYCMQLDLLGNQYVLRAMRAIREDFARKLSIESISDSLGVSVSYPSRKSKEVTGQTFLDFLSKYRVQQAIVILDTRQYRISEISETTRFTDYKHFYSVFKKYISKSPAKFAKGVSWNFVRSLTTISMDEIALTLERLHGLCQVYRK